MKTKTQTKKLIDFQRDFLKKPECILGGTGVGEGDIDRDKAGSVPPQGI